MDIYRLLATVGKKFFYENYEDIENERYDVIYKKYKGVWTEESIKSRYEYGRMIFNHNLQDEAMEIVWTYFKYLEDLSCCLDDLRPKIAQAMEQEFVGNFVFSDEEISQIFEFAGTVLRNYDTGYGNSISQGYDEWLFVAMVNAIKTWDSDENSFWECIFKKLLGYSNSHKVYLHLTKVIERLGATKKIF